MHILTAFYGGVLLLALMACGLFWVVAPKLAREIGQRLIISLLLFTATIFVWPTAASGVLMGSLELIFSFILFLSSVLYLIHPPLVRGALAYLGGGFVLSILFCLGLIALGLAHSGLMLLLIAGVAIGGIWLKQKEP